MNTRLFSKQTIRLLACAVAMAACLSPLMADDTEDALKTLQAAVEKEASQNASNDERSENYGARGNTGMMILAQLVQLRTAISRGETSQLDQVLSQIPVYLKSAAVREAADNLRTVVNAERAAKDQEFATRVDTAITAAAKAVQDAKKPADLDEILVNLALVQEQSDGRYSDKNRARIDKARSVRQFVTQWQNYLWNLNAGNIQNALQNLQSVSNENTAEIIPRSEILEKIGGLSKAQQGVSAQSQETPAQSQQTPAQKIREILDQTKSLDAIPAAIDALAEFQRQTARSSNNFNDPVVATIRELYNVLQAYRAFQAGVPSQLTVRMNQTNQEILDAFDSVLPLRVELLRLTAPQILNVGEDFKPTADETFQSFLDRAMAVAQARADARLIRRIKELQDSLGGKRNPESAMEALQALLAAQNQETAGQLLPAVISYQIALRNGGDLVPAKVIGARLDGIKSAHPEDYEKGMQLFLSDKAPPQPQYYRTTQPSNTITIPGSIAGKPAVAPPPAPQP